MRGATGRPGSVEFTKQVVRYVASTSIRKNARRYRQVPDFSLALVKAGVQQFGICLSTHSSPLVCSLAASPYVSIGTKSFAVETIALKPASAELRKIAPFFGHPLSLSLSDDTALILEGEDDERVWQQAARTSHGQIKVFPVLAGSVDQQGHLETFCVDLLSTLYDNPVAFSLRDGDGVVDEPLEHRPSLKRYRLQCNAMQCNAMQCNAMQSKMLF